MVHTLHETPKKLQHLTTATVILNRPVPGHDEKGPCDKGTRGRYPTRPEHGPSQGLRRGGRPPTSTDGKKGSEPCGKTSNGRRLMVRIRLRTRFFGLQRLRRARRTRVLQGRGNDRPLNIHPWKDYGGDGEIDGKSSGGRGRAVDRETIRR